MKERSFVTILLLLFSLVFTASINASKRVVIAEEITATWCTYCPGAQIGIHELKERAYDSLAVIAYHSSTSDPFYTSEAAQRASYYNLQGYPTMWIDGTLSVVGGQHSGNMYPSYRPLFNNRSQISSPLTIELSSSYNPGNGTGTVNANIKNTNAGTVTGTLQFVLTETNIPYNWQGQSILYDVVRDMLPDANGESVSIPAGDSIQKSRNFTINSSWTAENCNIVVFVQSSSKEIYQGAEVAVIPATELTYYGLNPTETSGNGNGVPEPGEFYNLNVSLKNIGTKDATGITATLSTTDPYITINSNSSSYPDVVIGDITSTSTPYSIDINSNCPDPHLAELLLNITSGSYSETDTIPFMVTSSPGFQDDMESGQESWTHSGLNDEWHLTTHRSNSSSHSWYCGIEGNWQYGNEIDASLVTPFFVVAQGTHLRFYQYYSTETNYDYGYIDIDNGSGWWMTVDEINGLHNYWSEATYNLAGYDGQTVRVRFRFISDPNTVSEGWYVDDVSFGVPASVRESYRKEKHNLFLKIVLSSKGAEISFGVPERTSVKMCLYDITGRKITTLYKGKIEKGTHHLRWNNKNAYGTVVSNGIYFVKLTTPSSFITKKIVVFK